MMPVEISQAITTRRWQHRSKRATLLQALMREHYLKCSDK